MSGLSRRFLVVLLIASVAGCGTFSGNPATGAARFHLPPGALVAVKQGPPGREIDVSYIQADRTPRPWRGCRGGLNPAGMDNMVGAVILTIWLVTCIIENAAEADRAARNDDEAARAALVKSVLGLRPLSERVQEIARADRLGEFPDLTDQSRQRLPDRSEFSSAPEYFIELGVSRLEMHAASPEKAFWFKFVAEGRLVQLDDSSVVDVFRGEAATNPTTIDSWNPERARRLSAEFDVALDMLAGKFVGEWIRPALTGTR